MDILHLIRSEKLGMRNSEKKVAACVLRDPDAAMRSSITELAEAADTSEPTVIRFCRRLGLSGYMELRLSLARALPSTKYILENVTDQDSFADIFNKIFGSAKEAFNDALSGMDLQLMEQAANALAKSERIEFYGLGVSGVVAQDSHHKFFRIGVPCVAYEDPHMQAMSAALLSSKDAVIAISHTGSTKDLIESVGIAKEAGATIIGITGRRKTPLSKYCHYDISVNSKEVAFRLAPMTSRLLQLAVIDVLYVLVAMKDFERIKVKLDKVKKALVNKRF